LLHEVVYAARNYISCFKTALCYLW
jgi:hypothetical protein